jgi:hypothetical protein
MVEKCGRKVGYTITTLSSGAVSEWTEVKHQGQPAYQTAELPGAVYIIGSIDRLLCTETVNTACGEP